jgi:hypothetical protein
MVWSNPAKTGVTSARKPHSDRCENAERMVEHACTGFAQFRRSCRMESYALHATVPKEYIVGPNRGLAPTEADVH